MDKKHMNITVDGCATPSVTLGFYTPIKASILYFLILFFKDTAMKHCSDKGRKKEPCFFATCK